MNGDTYGRTLVGRRFYPGPVIETILQRISAGESVTVICSDPSMPCAASWFAWCSTNPDLQSRYQAAREAAKRKE
jgi:hypothetical protein